MRFEPGLSRGSGGLAPGLVVAEDGKGDYGFLNLQQSAFDLTDRGVKGRDVTQPLDAQVFTERGVYRSGETVYVTALLRDDKGIAKEGVPLTLIAKRPDGVEYRRMLIADQGAGGRSYALPLLPSSASGTWRVQAYVDPKGAPVGETTFLVEDYVPERLDFKLKPRETQVRAGDTTTIDTNSRYLYGAPGSGLDVGGEVTVEAAGDHGLPVLRGYQAGLQDQTFEAVSKDLPTIVTTDDKGDAAIDVPIPDIAATQPLEAKVVLRVGEPGGRAVERNVTLPILPKGGLIGVKKDFTSLGDGDIANFDVIAINSSAARVARKGVTWSLYRLITDYQWYNQDGHWDFEEVKSSRRVATGTLDLTADALGKIAAPVELGDYRLDVCERRSERCADQRDLRRRLVRRGDGGRARSSRSHARQGGLRAGRRDEAQDRLAFRRHGDGRDPQRSARIFRAHRREEGRQYRQRSGRRELGRGRLCRRLRASPARSGGAAQSWPRAWARLVQHRRREPQARYRHRRAGETAPA